MLKKISTLFILVALITTTCFADDIDTEQININQIYTEEIQASASVVDKPKINSRYAVVIDRESKRILYGKNSNEKTAMASTTKIMTAIIALENSKLEEEIIVSNRAANIGGSRLGLETGDKVSMNDLLYGLMLCSGNDAAVQIAETIGGDYKGFAVLMNKKAKELGLNNTHFVTPHGLDDKEHYTTAYELAILTDYALKNKKFSEIVSCKTKTILINGKQRELYNTNELLGNLEGINGVKTGFTNNAGRCLVTSCTRNGKNIISVVLGADSKKIRTKDSIQIIEYTYANYSEMDLKKKVEKAFEAWQQENKIEIIKGKQESILPKIEEEFPYKKYPVKEEEQITIEINCEGKLEAPVEKNRKVGNIVVKNKEQEILNLSLVTPISVKKKDEWEYWKELWKAYLIK